MKILIITSNIGRTAPGIVFERIVYGLSEINDVTILTHDFDPSFELSRVKQVIKYKYANSGRFRNKFIATFSIDPLDIFFVRNAIGKCKNEYDLVLSFVSFNHYFPVIAGKKFASKYGIKNFVYCVDAIPAPNGWLKEDSFYKGTQQLISKYFAHIHGLFSSNKKMLDYQMTTFNPRKDIVKDVIYNPTFGEIQEFKNCWKDNYFLYTGGLYGPRSVIFLFQAFKLLLKKYPNSYLEFVGSVISESDLSTLDALERKKVLIHPYTKNLKPFYERSTALIDIDANIENDVFLSSKITNYLLINRVIISETGINSPSRQLFKGLNSILQCDHDPVELAEAMEIALLKRHTVNFTDRRDVIKLFDLKLITFKLNQTLKNAYSRY